MKGEAISEKLWDEWKQNPCTKRLMEWANEQRIQLMEMWASGGFSAAFDMEMAVKNAGATGACSVYEEIKDLDFDQIANLGDKDAGQQPANEQVRT